MKEGIPKMWKSDFDYKEDKAILKDNKNGKKKLDIAMCMMSIQDLLSAFIPS